MADLVIASPCPPLFEPETRSEDEFLQPLMQNFVGWYRHAAQERHARNYRVGVQGARRGASGFRFHQLDRVGRERASSEGGVPSSVGRAQVGSTATGSDQLSDGQRSLIALYCLVFFSNGGRTSLFLDEPDNYLALREIQPWLAAVAEHCGDTLEQAVVVSHHPVRRSTTWPVRRAGGSTVTRTARCGSATSRSERSTASRCRRPSHGAGTESERSHASFSSARTRRRMRSCAGF